MPFSWIHILDGLCSDFPWAKPEAMVEVTIIAGVRQDKARAVKTEFASNRRAHPFSLQLVEE